MDSESRCVRIGRIFVKIYMLHVTLLKYDAMRSFSSLRSFVDFSLRRPRLFRSYGLRVTWRTASAVSGPLDIHGAARVCHRFRVSSCYHALVSGLKASRSRRALILPVVGMLNCICFPFSRMGICTKLGLGPFSLPSDDGSCNWKFFLASYRSASWARLRSPPFGSLNDVQQNAVLDVYVSRPMCVSLGFL